MYLIASFVLCLRVYFNFTKQRGLSQKLYRSHRIVRKQNSIEIEEFLLDNYVSKVIHYITFRRISKTFKTVFFWMASFCKNTIFENW
jgi:hypothetical protein